MPWDILGHEWAVELLQHDLGLGRVRHAYLFTGPEGVGKRTLASAFARALLCPERDAPCGRCRHCVLAARGSHPDLFSVSPVVSGKRILSAKIKIEPVRELIYSLSLKPVEARRRLACVWQFDLAEDAAQNAFLKTLEEPPGDAVILLTASQPEALLPTIVSRCEILALRPLPVAKVQQALAERWSVPEARAELLAHLSGGRPGWALNMHADEDALHERSRRLDELCGLFGVSRVTRFAYAESLSKAGTSDQIQATLELWLAFLRDLLLLSTGTDAPLANPDRADDLRRLADGLSPEDARTAIQSLRRTLDLLGRNVNARLALEVFMLDLPRPVSPN